ncbi:MULTISPECIES: ATP-binding protein [Spirulina sp. CCY15215]|uniref:hybrid sensor histidine kinase/response regulator n=1 Tax=Spirulina sp. CCY15215 TaxID=2767591 RepID=UPI001950D456|nr:ATP-binding protein [Spirulina major]
MLSSSPTLKQFIRPVPVCEQSANIEALLAIFQEKNTEIIIALGESRYPLGVVRLSRLLLYINSNLSLKNISLQGKKVAVKTMAAIAPQEGRDQWQETFRFTPFVHSLGHQRDREDRDFAEILEPITILPTSLSIEETRSHLQREDLGRDRQYCALVDEEGRFQGLLNVWQLLNAVLPKSPTTDPQTLKSLLTLLEQLPMPLMLQGEHGQVIQQNSVWKQQISMGMGGSGALTALELAQCAHEDEKNLKVDFHPEAVFERWCNFIAERDEEECNHNPIANEEEFADREANFLNSSNRVWQFVKLPLRVRSMATSHTSLWLILATDVTEQRQLCKELTAKNADLIQLNRLKDEFLACISHELKTPLTAVLGLSSLLKDKKLGELNQRQSRYSQLIYQSGQQLMSVVNDILDLTRIETGQLKLTPEPVQLQEVCDRAYQQARKQLFAGREKDPATIPEIKFSLTIAPELETIVADELRLRQMLVHLLENALKFTPNGGEIGLQVNRWQGWIDFTVSDTGIGIPESAQHLIFQKFQQLESPLTRQFEGTGLGLVLTQRLARAHGGDISFTSQVGRGSKFTLLLPPAPPEREASRDRLRSTLEPNRLILIVEAVPQYIERLTGQLQKLGYRAIVARSGTEALEKTRQIQPRAIFLNPLLPLLSGWDVLTLLKADSKTKNIPVIVTATQAEKLLAQQNEADSFLSLPIQPQALQKSLSRLKALPPLTRNSLTILHLHGGLLDKEDSEFVTKLGWMFNNSNMSIDRLLPLDYRILEANDLDQAEVVARIWKPDVLLLNGQKIKNPDEYLRAIAQVESLVQLPLVTLDAKIAEYGNKIPGLSVFPCLIPITEQSMAAFLQVIQVAAGVSKQSNILIVEAGSECYQSDQCLRETQDTQIHAGIDFSHALTQYLQTAGLRSLLAKSWTEVYSQIHHRSVDLLIINLGESKDLGCWLEGLKQLANLTVKPPILVLEHDSLTGTGSWELNEFLSQLATKVIVDDSQSMPELLTQINQMLI